MGDHQPWFPRAPSAPAVVTTALVEQLGGRATPGVGFAMGLERLVLLVRAVNPEFKADPVVDIYLVASGTDTQSAAMRLAEQVRDALPGVKLMTNHGGGNFKQFARADRVGGARRAGGR